MSKKHVLIGITALTLALTGTAAASDWVCPPIIEPDPPPVVVPADPGSGDPDRVGYCILGADGSATFIDLIKDQPYLEPLDPRWLDRTVVAANVGLPGNPNAIWC